MTQCNGTYRHRSHPTSVTPNGLSDSRSTDGYDEYTRKRNPSLVWKYFLTATDRNSAKCKICSRIVKTLGSSTSGLHGHLRLKHGIKIDPIQIRKPRQLNSPMQDPETVFNDEVVGKSYEVVLKEDRKSKKHKAVNESSVHYFENETVPMKKKRRTYSSMWKFFLRSSDHQTAKCKICSKIIKTKGSSTGNMINHMKQVHKSYIENSTESFTKVEKEVEMPLTVIKQEATVTPDDEIVLDLNDVHDNNIEIQNEHSYQIDIQNAVTPMKIISRMVALDGIPLRSFTSSPDLRKLLTDSGYDLPSSDIETVSMILQQTDIVMLEVARELKTLIDAGVKFCLVLEEFLTAKDEKYISLKINNEDSHFGETKNLGLIKIFNEMENKLIIQQIVKRLQSFDLNLYKDIISLTTSSTLSEIKFGTNVELDSQACLAQGIQNGVIEVLYNEDVAATNLRRDATDESDDDSECMKETRNAFFVKPPDITREPQLIHSSIIDKVRKIVRYYKNSASRNELLQKKVKKKYDKEIPLILDCRKRWSTLCEMIGRFLKLKDCIHETLTYLEMDLFIRDEELQILSEIHDSLVVIKATVTALCKPNANLLTADAALRFMFRKLDNQNTEFCRRFATAIKNQIKTRRTHLSSMLQYLHDRHTYIKCQDEDVFRKLTDKNIVSNILSLLTRLNPHIKDRINNKLISRDVVRKIYDPLESDDDEETSIEKQLENEIKTCRSEAPKPKLDPQNLDLEKIIMGELSIYESAGGGRGSYLTTTYEILLSIAPATSEAEKFFFAKRDAHNRLSCHPEAMLNSLFMLRSYFKQQTNEQD
ncbi:unnamed protein product [Leptosia nina]|uniref:BED-type domain-containing protein n=1 Tax=Leptosia nina TaxID=320188 RepID=A0AAV1IW78_9NEOP